MSTTPEIWYKAQRVVRTIVQFLIVAVPLANGLAAAAIEYLRVQQDVPVPPWVFLALNAVLAVTALLIGLVARLMAVPGVNDRLTRIGLGSVPPQAVVTMRDNAGTWQHSEVLHDPNVPKRG